MTSSGKSNVGDTKNFDLNWQNTTEARYLHWTREEPINQIQLAFRQHWLTFKELLPNLPDTSVLEVGCGRGSLSAYFADDGWDCTLLDLSASAIDLAKKAFYHNGLKAKFKVGDCLSLPFQDSSFSLVFSIGLLEHFDDFHSVIAEQYRILKPGGMFIGYVVPEMKDNIQKEYDWICEILKTYTMSTDDNRKTDIYRSDQLSEPYIQAMLDIGFASIKSSGIYPLPMISHSIEFPFSLMNPDAELILVNHFNAILKQRRTNGEHQWLCDEENGQAFLVWGIKK